MRRRSLIAALAAAAIGPELPGKGLPAEPAPPTAGNEIAFHLVDPSGHTVRAADLRGRWMLVFFGYTFCPDLCPTALNEIAGALAQPGPLAARIQPVFVSMDPQRERPEALRDYVRGFDERILPLSGPVPNQPVEYDASHQFAIISGFQLSAIFTKPSAGNAAAATNPHRRPSVHRFPAGSFFRGFRTPALYRIDRSCSGRHPKPFRKPVIRTCFLRTWDNLGALCPRHTLFLRRL
jgi:hypothetical protein